MGNTTKNRDRYASFFVRAVWSSAGAMTTMLAAHLFLGTSRDVFFGSLAGSLVVLTIAGAVTLSSRKEKSNV